MRLTPKHVGMEIQICVRGADAWERLRGFRRLISGQEIVDAGRLYTGMDADYQWRVRKPQKKGKGRKCGS